MVIYDYFYNRRRRRRRRRRRALVLGGPGQFVAPARPRGIESIYMEPDLQRLKTVAPLKETISEYDVAANSTVERPFPRLKNRGPIEAENGLMVCGSHLIFPRLKDRGPIDVSIPGFP